MVDIFYLRILLFVFLLVNSIAKHDLTPFYIYGLIILVLVAADIVSQGDAARMLLIFSVLGIVALIIGMVTKGMISVYSIINTKDVLSH